MTFLSLVSVLDTWLIEDDEVGIRVLFTDRLVVTSSELAMGRLVAIDVDFTEEFTSAIHSALSKIGDVVCGVERDHVVALI